MRLIVNKCIGFLSLSLMFLSFAQGQEQFRWDHASDGGIIWNVSAEEKLPHSDNIEMDGQGAALIVSYEVDSQKMVTINRHVIYPQYRTFLKDNDRSWARYRAYLKKDYKSEVQPKILVNHKYHTATPLKSVKINGNIQFDYQTSKNGLSISQQMLPASTSHAVVERWVLRNDGQEDMEIEVGAFLKREHDFGLGGGYYTEVSIEEQKKMLLMGEELSIEIHFAAFEFGGMKPKISFEEESEIRNQFLKEMKSNLVLRTPEPVLNKLFEFSKIRASESIYDSKMGLVHSPGGGRYYAGVWANDQAEYAGPFFPYLGNEKARIASINAYKKFYSMMKEIPNHDQNLWSSFEMSGDLTCCGGDRGDAAMIAYGAGHFLLAQGDKALSKEYFPMIEWCLEYCDKKKTAEGVIASDTDEMEGRIATGSANLSTSSLYYGALLHAIDLGKELEIPEKQLEKYQEDAKALRSAIDAYFGAKVEGLETYKYFKEHKYLRHWICLPLVVGIHDRKEATIEALFERLWTDNGVHVEKNSDDPDIAKIFWDRATLYALRGALIAGETEVSVKHLIAFSENRLLGERVPYVVEAYPEGQMAHLSAESALYARAIIEGLFGIYPTGHRSFKITPRLPTSWDEMDLIQIKAFGSNFDIKVVRLDTQRLKVIMTNHETGKEIVKKLKAGESVVFSLL